MTSPVKPSEVVPWTDLPDPPAPADHTHGPQPPPGKLVSAQKLGDPHPQPHIGPATAVPGKTGQYVRLATFRSEQWLSVYGRWEKIVSANVDASGSPFEHSEAVSEGSTLTTSLELSVALSFTAGIGPVELAAEIGATFGQQISLNTQTTHTNKFIIKCEKPHKIVSGVWWQEALDFYLWYDQRIDKYYTETGKSGWTRKEEGKSESLHASWTNLSPHFKLSVLTG